MRLLDGCTALVTGASSGIGREIARLLAGRAKVLHLVARRGDRLELLREELGREGLALHCHVADLADARQAGELAARLVPEGIDVLVNNAGLGDHGCFEASDWARTAAMLEVNIRALTQMTHALLPGMVAAKRGAVLNVSSIASFLPVPKMAVYAASKAYVTSFSEALRMELRGSGVSVTALCPGPVNTEFFDVAERAGTDEKMPTPEMMKVSAAAVARSGLQAVERDHARVIPGWHVSALIRLASLVPMFLLRLGMAPKRRDRNANACSRRPGC